MIVHLLLSAVSLFLSPAPIDPVDADAKKKHIVFLISEDPDNYEAPRTIPPFAEMLSEDHGFRTTVLLGEGDRSAFRFPGFEVIADADLVVVFCRRVALPHDQMQMLKNYLAKGKPLVGIRTAHHAFSPREGVARGHDAWPEFPADILGCENKGYGSQDAGLDVRLVEKERKHPVLNKVEPLQWHGEGSIYHVALLDPMATVLVKGKFEDKVEPIAWTRVTKNGSRVFYTSLGYPSDFDKEQYRRLLINGINWAMKGN